GDGAAERIAQQGAAIDAGLVEKATQTADEEVQVVIDVVGLVGAAEAWQIQHYVAVAGLGKQRIVALEVAEAAGAGAAAVQPDRARACADVMMVQCMNVVEGDLSANWVGDGNVVVGVQVQALSVSESLVK